MRAEAARTELGTPASTELLVAVDAVTSSRRARVAAAAREIPALYVLTLVASGLALIANAGALAFRSSLRTSLLVVGLASVVGLSLALLFSLSATWWRRCRLAVVPGDAGQELPSCPHAGDRPGHVPSGTSAGTPIG